MNISFKKHCPIYVNTLNVFRPLKTWLKNRNVNFPKISCQYVKISTIRDFEKVIYSWYLWDHSYEWEFDKKWLVILIDDVQYKYKFGRKELESVPFILIKFLKHCLVFKFNDPDGDNYRYWESMT